MDIRIACYSCGQHIVVDSSAGGSMVSCPSCRTELIIPEVLIETSPATSIPSTLVAVQPPPLRPIPATIPQPVHIQPAPPRQRSIGWGVFWGLFGFFIVLPLVVGIGLLFLGVGLPSFVAARKAAQENAAHAGTNQPATDSLSPDAIEAAEKRDYIRNNLTLYDFTAKYHDSALDGTVPGVDFKLRNKGTRTLRQVEVTVYFKDKVGAVIWEEKYHPVLVNEFSSDRTPLKPGFIWQMERGRFYSAKKVPSECDLTKSEAGITEIEFDKAETEPGAEQPTRQ